NPPSLDPFETAFLAAGAGRAIQAAIVALVQEGCLAVKSASDIRSTGQSPRDPTPLESSVVEAVVIDGSSSIPQIRAGSAGALRAIDDRLVSEALLLAPAMRKLITLITLGATGWVLLMGIVKIFVGVSRGRPVGFLISLCMLSLIAMGILLTTTPRTTPAG